VAAQDEAEQLVERAGGDAGLLESLVRRRLTGEPLAWITGSVRFCDMDIRVDPGVYVPRPHTEQLANRAARLLPAGGVAVDLCTGSGAVARVLQELRPRARIVASDIDERAVACARRNGVEAYLGDLFAPLADTLERPADVVVAVVPYVPTAELALLHRDTLTFESPRAYDGGRDGTDLLRRVLAESRELLGAGGAILLELGGGQAELLRADSDRLGYAGMDVLVDEDGDVRGIEATLRR